MRNKQSEHPLKPIFLAVGAYISALLLLLLEILHEKNQLTFPSTWQVHGLDPQPNWPPTLAFSQHHSSVFGLASSYWIHMANSFFQFFWDRNVN